VIVLVNAADEMISIELNLPEAHGRQLVDLLDAGDPISISAEGKVKVDVWPHWLRIMAVR
jgi:hypothetical protein